MSITPAQRAALRAKGYTDDQITAAYGPDHVGVPDVTGGSSSTAPAPFTDVQGGASSTAKTALTLQQYSALREKGHSPEDIAQHYTPPKLEAAAFERAGPVEGSGIVNQLAQGAFRGGASELNAIAGTVKDALPEALGGAPGVSIFDPKSLKADIAGRAEGHEAGLSKFAGEHPIAATASQIAGGAVESGVESLLTGGAAGVKNAASLGQRIMSGIGAGAKYGGEYGFLGTRGGLKERAEGAVRGLESGAAIGGALPIAAAAVKTVAPIAGRAIGITTEGGRLAKYDTAVDQAIDQTGQTAADVEQRHAALSLAGKQPTTLESLGPAGVKLLDDLSALPAQSSVRREAANLLKRLKQDPESADLAASLQSALTRKPTAIKLYQRGTPAGLVGYAVGGAPGATAGAVGSVAVQAGARRSAQQEAETALERLLQPSRGIFGEPPPAPPPPEMPSRLRSSLPQVSRRSDGPWGQPATPLRIIPASGPTAVQDLPATGATRQLLEGTGKPWNRPGPEPDIQFPGESMEQQVAAKLLPETVARKQAGATAAQLNARGEQFLGESPNLPLPKGRQMGGPGPSPAEVHGDPSQDLGAAYELTAKLVKDRGLSLEQATKVVKSMMGGETLEQAVGRLLRLQ